MPSGAIKLDISPVHDTPLACLSTELIPLLPVSEKNIRPTKEVLEFPSSEVYVPHNIYRWVRCSKMKIKLGVYWFMIWEEFVLNLRPVSCRRPFHTNLMAWLFSLKSIFQLLLRPTVVSHVICGNSTIYCYIWKLLQFSCIFSSYVSIGICFLCIPRGLTLWTGWHQQETSQSKSSLWVERIPPLCCLWVTMNQWQNLFHC